MNTVATWLHNARSIALPQSMLPGIVAIGMALQYEGFSVGFALVALFGVMAAHLGMNLADDYFDYQIGSGEKRVRMASEGMRARIAKYPYLSSGEASLKELKMAIVSFLGVSMVAGAVIVYGRGTFPLYIALVGAFLGISYSGWPFRLAYHGLGELVVGLMFGPLLMIGVQYAACGVLDTRILLTSTAMGLLVTNILYSHSVLDRQADARMDKTTLALLLDKRETILFASAVFNFLPFVLILMETVLGMLHPAYLAVFLVFPIAVYLWRSLKDFVDGKHTDIVLKPWMGPMGNFPAYRKAGIDWFMLRWLLARNLMSFFGLILLVVNVVLKICTSF